ncbi:McKusick-Kaufman/Bardet-Biedl syndromes putative chaperonin [Alligator mississippiensis]|uniref:McKusick-Kaufman/Bardet-Biedl syndromes putative chaperonin n=1 Tax=Alligator mississippiensis TaxID=8496 RepID=A0A151MGW5_ALLMI|nr:McKusick-Kaufman/Bardet-Biedl syndromes putative chaperonin [Alligator mississippiensis]
MEPLSQMTGSKPIAAIYSLSPSCYGSLKDLRTENFVSKHFLHLIPNDTLVCSLILCNRNETAWDELKVACQTAEHVLQLTVKQPLALLGGGCTETHLASYVKYKVFNLPTSTFESLDCSQAQYQLVADAFCHSLESIACCLEHDNASIQDEKRSHSPRLYSFSLTPPFAGTTKIGESASVMLLENKVSNHSRGALRKSKGLGSCSSRALLGGVVPEGWGNGGTEKKNDFNLTCSCSK